MNKEAQKRKSLGLELFNIVEDNHNLPIPPEICQEIELLSLNDEEINIIEINYELFTHMLLRELIRDVNYVENELYHEIKLTKLFVNDNQF